MFGILYIFLMILVGDIFCRRFYDFETVTARFAASFAVGLVFSTWLTYLFALCFAGTAEPLFYGNLLFFIGTGALVLIDTQFNAKQFRESWYFRGTPFSEYAWTLGFGAVTAWLMFGSFGFEDDKILLSGVVWNDFGTHLSLIQSFVVGRNFPTEYPFFIGEPIRYHFLFWFQAANLTWLGLRIDRALNLLSVLSMTSMLVLLMTLGEILFKSKAVGRIAAVLFFFHGSLSAIPFLLSAESLADAFNKVITLNDWIKSIYPYSGEQWGVWSIGTFYSQRHLTMVIAVFLLVLIFVCKKLQMLNESAIIEANSGEFTEVSANETLAREAETEVAEREFLRFENRQTLYGFIFSGVLLGLLPTWNSAIYLCAAAIFGMFLILQPRRFKFLLALLLPAAVLAIPQILFLRAGAGRNLSDLIKIGYVVDPPNLENIVGYFAFTFGLKTGIAVLAVVFLQGLPRRLFFAALILPVLAFTTQLSADIMNNHKFLTIWIILLNFFVAFALWELFKKNISAKIPAVFLFLLICSGGAIEFFRIYNDEITKLPFGKNAVYYWLYTATKPEDIFLSDMYSHHPILFTGRRVFYGWSYFGWSMGYKTEERDKIWKQMLQEKKGGALLTLLREHKINYIAYDNGLRNGEFKETLNEETVAANFVKVFEDKKGEADGLTIYKVY